MCLVLFIVHFNSLLKVKVLKLLLIQSRQPIREPLLALYKDLFLANTVCKNDN